MKSKYLTLLLALVASGLAYAQGTTVNTAIVGGYQMTCPKGNDTYISVPVNRPAEFTGVVADVDTTSKVIWAENDIGIYWDNNQWVYAQGVQSNKYYLRFKTGALEGAWFNIVSNGQESLTLNISDSDILLVADNDEYEIIPHWTLTTLYPNGEGFTKSTALSQGVSCSLIYKHTSIDSNNEPVMEVGADTLPVIAYYYRDRSTTQRWQKQVGTTHSDATDEILEPMFIAFVRQAASLPSDVIASSNGAVPACAFSLEFGQLVADSAQDNYVAIPTCAGMKVSDLTSAMIIVGNPDTSPIKYQQGGLSPTPAGRDTVLYYNNTISTGLNILPDYSFMYWNSTTPANSGWYRSGIEAWRDRNVNDMDLEGGKVFFIRKVAATTPAFYRVQIRPTYLDLN